MRAGCHARKSEERSLHYAARHRFAREGETRGFGRDDVMGEMARRRVLSAAAVRRATTNKRYGAGETPAVRKTNSERRRERDAACVLALSLLRTVAQAGLPVLLKVKEPAGGPSFLRTSQRYEKRQRRLETTAAATN